MAISTNALPLAHRPLHPVFHLPVRHTLSSFTTECSFCGALHFLEERIQDSRVSDPLFEFCCHKGKVRLAIPTEPPEPLISLFTRVDSPYMSFSNSVADSFSF